MARAALQQDEITAFRKKATVAAMHLFGAQGYEAVTMRSLAAEMGVSAMTPYRYVAGKDELFALVRCEAFRRFADHLDAALARAGQPLERLRRLKKAYVAFVLGEPDAYRVMFELRQPDPEAFPELVAESKRAYAFLQRTVKEAVDAGVLDGNPLTLAHLMWASTHGLVSLHLAGRIPRPQLEKLAAIDHELLAFTPAEKKKKS